VSSVTLGLWKSLPSLYGKLFHVLETVGHTEALEAVFVETLRDCTGQWWPPYRRSQPEVRPSQNLPINPTDITEPYSRVWRWVWAQD
jgi:hypothetical protein